MKLFQIVKLLVFCTIAMPTIRGEDGYCGEKEGVSVKACPCDCKTTTEVPDPLPKDCYEILKKEKRGFPSGVHTIQPLGGTPVQVFCNQNLHGGGLTMIQRKNHTHPRVNFTRDFDAYRKGFGDPNNGGDFWLGNDNLHQITGSGKYKMILEYIVFGPTYNGMGEDDMRAVYSKVKVEGFDSGFRLGSLTFSSGSAGDPMAGSKGREFSTWDRDRDGNNDTNCASETGAGWWFGSDCTPNFNSPQNVSWTYNKKTYKVLHTSMSVQPNYYKHDDVASPNWNPVGK